MKTLGKLNINPEKVVKNEELIALRGGYGSLTIQVRCGLTPNYTTGCFTVTYDDWDLAAAAIADVCYPNGATFGSTCPE